MANKFTNLWMPEDFYEGVKGIAQQRYTSISAVVRDAVREYLQKEGVQLSGGDIKKPNFARKE